MRTFAETNVFMKIEKSTVDQLAELCKLEFNDIEKEKIAGDLEKIVGFIEKLNELDVEHVEPLVYMSDEVNVLRPDEVKQDLELKDVLENAPKKDSDYIRVPKVLEKGE